jgi:hypothetical protein
MTNYLSIKHKNVLEIDKKKEITVPLHQKQT